MDEDAFSGFLLTQMEPGMCFVFTLLFFEMLLSPIRMMGFNGFQWVSMKF